MLLGLCEYGQVVYVFPEHALTRLRARNARAALQATMDGVYRLGGRVLRFAFGMFWVYCIRLRCRLPLQRSHSMSLRIYL